MGADASATEIDGNEFTTDALSWSPSFKAERLLEVSINPSTSEGVDDGQFASLAMH